MRVRVRRGTPRTQSLRQGWTRESGTELNIYIKERRERERKFILLLENLTLGTLYPTFGEFNARLSSGRFIGFLESFPIIHFTTTTVLSRKWINFSLQLYAYLCCDHRTKIDTSSSSGTTLMEARSSSSQQQQTAAGTQ